jgi:hypothetical protein
VVAIVDINVMIACYVSSKDLELLEEGR